MWPWWFHVLHSNILNGLDICEVCDVIDIVASLLSVMIMMAFHDYREVLWWLWWLSCPRWPWNRDVCNIYEGNEDLDNSPIPHLVTVTLGTAWSINVSVSPMWCCICNKSGCTIRPQVFCQADFVEAQLSLNVLSQPKHPVCDNRPAWQYLHLGLLGGCPNLT